MKAIVALLVVAAICQLSHAEFAHNLNLNTLDRLSSRSVGEKFKKALEDLKELLRQGNETAGIPVLDPLNLNQFEFNLQNELINLQGEVTDLLLEGLSNYVVQNADFKFTGKKVTVDFLWSSIAAKTKYNVPSGLVLSKFPVYGDGDLVFKLSELGFATQANIKMDTKADRLSVLSFTNTTITLGKLEADLTGLYKDDELSALVSAVISDNVADFLNDFHGEIVILVNQIMMQTANDILKDKSLKAILRKLR